MGKKFFRRDDESVEEEDSEVEEQAWRPRDEDEPAEESGDPEGDADADE